MILLGKFPRAHPAFRVLCLPFLARFYRYAYHHKSDSRWEMRWMKILRKFFPVFRRFRGTSTGEFEYDRNGQRTKIIFNARNVQFLGVYVPVHGYEPEVAALLDSMLPEGGTFYDIGSNWGYFTLYAASSRAHVTIHSFEPLPETYQDLVECVQQAELSSAVTCHNLALSDKDSEAFIEIPDGLHSGSAEITPRGSIRIITRKLDTLGLPPPDFIKLDAENHELEILRGAVKTLETARPFIVFENKPDYLRPEKILEVLFFLAGMDYQFYVPAVSRKSATHDFFMQAGWHPVGENDQLALIPFQPAARLLYQHELNVFACHKSRKSELLAKFKSWP
jgi:FkbM family methyltransferase